jgi:hypothetical protein
MNGYAEDYAVFFFDLVEPDAREKRLAAAWKIYEAGRMQGLLPSTPFQSVSRRLPRKYMRRKKRKEFSQTTTVPHVKGSTLSNGPSNGLP